MGGGGWGKDRGYNFCSPLESQGGIKRIGVMGSGDMDHVGIDER